MTSLTGSHEPGRGGTTLVVLTAVPVTFDFFDGQIAHLKTCGFEVHAVSSPGPLLDQLAARDQIQCHAIKMTRGISPLRDLTTIVRLARLFKRVRPSIVHAHMPKGGLLGMLAARLAGVPMRIYHNHGMPYVIERGPRRVLLRWTEELTYLQAHQVLCVSDSVRRIAVRDGTCAPDRIKVLMAGSINGVDAAGRFDPERFGPEQRARTRAAYGIPADALVVGFVGRLKRDKGLVELAAAWRTLRDRFPALHLLLVGPLEELDPVPADTLAALGRDSRVHLIGENRDTPPLYAAMDIFCLPTYTEGMPVAPLEAAAMGLAVVATQVSGCVDAVQDGVTGTLVPSRDAHALAAALEAYLVNAPVRHDHGAAGRDRMLREFRPEALWNAQAAEYARLLQGSGLPLPAALPFKGQYSGSPLFRNGSRVTRTAGDGHDGSGLTTHHGGPVDQRQRIRDVIRVNETGLPWRRPGLGRRAKRAIDLVGGTAAAIVALPIMAAVGIGVAATSRGPVVLKQERVGLDGRAFTMWKFRSMRADYPDGQARGRGEVVRTDPRLTPIGRFLRDWRLDELPQLFQVIRGQMSLIGPRPDLPANLPAYADDELLRFAMPPGCTAWTFTRGLFENDWRTRQLIHVEYVRQWSLWLDLKILAGTAWVLLRQQATSPTTAETPRSESEAR